MNQIHKKLCGQLQSYFDEALAAADKSIFKKHLEICSKCREALSRLSALHFQICEAATKQGISDEADFRIRKRLHRELNSRRSSSEILDLEEVARLMQIPVRDVIELLDQLPSFEISGRIRFRHEKMLAWIQERERKHSLEKKDVSSELNNKLIVFPGGSI